MTLKHLPIRWLLATALLGAGGCATPDRLAAVPLSQSEVDQFLAGGRDARTYGITIYPGASGTRFEFANRPRPERRTRKPVIPGLQTAVVVGKGGDEICTDKHGRIKIRFHWDRADVGGKEENRSCWVRVAQMWAGKGWGTQFIPRVGMEVVVSFLEGDPDRPLVIGAVYNGANGAGTKSHWNNGGGMSWKCK